MMVFVHVWHMPNVDVIGFWQVLHVATVVASAMEDRES
jgi:hypothetical protein